MHGELVVSPSSGRKVLEFVCIQVRALFFFIIMCTISSSWRQRRDNGVWSLPGGMVDPGEGFTTTLVRWILTTCFSIHDFGKFFVVREFMEEALDSIETGSKKVSHALVEKKKSKNTVI